MSETVTLLARATSGEGVKSGPWGLAIILLLCVACYFLFKSMSKHLRRVREEFPTDPPTAPTTSRSASSNTEPGATADDDPSAAGRDG